MFAYHSSRNSKFCAKIADTETSGKISSQNSDVKRGIPPLSFGTIKIVLVFQLS